MLAIRMQRTGRGGHAQFRVIVQDSHFHPTRGRIVAYLGSYDPHTKSAQLDKEVAVKYLGHGAQPSDRVARLLKKEGVKLPDWVQLDSPKKRAIRHPEKLRRNRPAGEPAPAEPKAETPADEAAATEANPETAPEVQAEGTSTETAPAEEAVAEEPKAAEAPVEEPTAPPEPEIVKEPEVPGEAPTEPAEDPAKPEAKA